MNILKQNDLEFLWSVLHPQFFRFGGNLWMTTSADKRCFAFTASGDCRSEVAFTHLDEYILSI
jgi:hypothetical protein